MKFLLLPILFSLLAGCSGKQAGNTRPETPETTVNSASQGKIGTLEKQLQAAGLTDIQTLEPGIQVELKYSTTDNFLHADVYGDLTHAYLQPDVAEMLVHAWQILQEKDSSYTFIIYDAVRPLRIQQKMWEILQMPIEEKGKYLSNPKNGSIHNYGAAVDMSLIKKDGRNVDMGTPFDFFGPLAEPQLEPQMLREGKLTDVQLANRKLLREVMQKAGFRQLPAEWWHYNACTREEAKIRYTIVN